MSRRIFINTRSINDYDYVGLDTRDNKRISEFETANYRTQEFTRNPNYLFPFDHTFYDLQAIDEGKGPGMNPDLDSRLTRGNVVVRPPDRLAASVNFIRYVDFLPPIETPIDHNKFFVSTSLSTDPQRKFSPTFFRPGVNSKHFHRMTDEFYRDIAHHSNATRLPAKYIR